MRNFKEYRFCARWVKRRSTSVAGAAPRVKIEGRRPRDGDSLTDRSLPPLEKSNENHQHSIQKVREDDPPVAVEENHSKDTQH